MSKSCLAGMTSLMSPLVTLAAHWLIGVASDTDVACACGKEGRKKAQHHDFRSGRALITSQNDSVQVLR
jgi:hypothetical protein